MKRLLWIAPLCLALITSSAHANLADEILVLAQNNVSEDVMIAFIKENPRGVSRLTANDIIKLKEAGVTDRLVTSLIAKMGVGAPAGQEQPAAAPVFAEQPQGLATEVTAPAPPAPIYDTTYYVDTSYPVPVYYDYPLFPFGVDLFANPFWYCCSYLGCPLYFTDFSLCRHHPHCWDRFGFNLGRPSFWGHRTPYTHGFTFDRRLWGQRPPARGAVAAASLNLAARVPVANRVRQAQSPVVRRMESARVHQTQPSVSFRSQSLAARSYHSYSAPSYHSYSAPSYHSYSAPSYHSYSPGRSFSYGGGSFHSSGGGGFHSFGGGGGFHGGSGGGHHR